MYGGGWVGSLAERHAPVAWPADEFWWTRAAGGVEQGFLLASPWLLDY